MPWVSDVNKRKVLQREGCDRDQEKGEPQLEAGSNHYPMLKLLEIVLWWGEDRAHHVHLTTMFGAGRICRGRCCRV